MASDDVISNRPFPPIEFVEEFAPYIKLTPATGVHEWVIEQIISENGVLHNPDHMHLLEADIAFLWAATAFTKQGRTVLGQAEEVMMRAGGWQKARMEQQLYEWFGHKPDFIITLAGDFCSQCSDLEFCALVEHELYHIAQATDEFGAPKFYRDSGLPKLCMRGHDVEEFTGVVRRYGASADVQELINAAANPAEVANLDIARACGTCLMKLA
ncbi:putative metallopeptidase [Pantoea sp. ME81]|uniref:putative metallopeptidase n=1 Tax=Pantoea sp. ME81 TaxID=2743935 RepID=UPI0015F764F3|nr:putative metallopeptidase [Pantoea sp. ME81]